MTLRHDVVYCCLIITSNDHFFGCTVIYTGNIYNGILFIDNTAHYRLQTKLRKGNVFTSMCQEFCPGGQCLPQCMLGNTHPGRQPPGQTPSWADTPLGRHPPGQTPLSRHPQADTPPGQTHPPGQTPHSRADIPLMATAVDDTHPTAMHSCCLIGKPYLAIIASNVRASLMVPARFRETFWQFDDNKVVTNQLTFFYKWYHLRISMQNSTSRRHFSYFHHS